MRRGEEQNIFPDRKNQFKTRQNMFRTGKNRPSPSVIQKKDVSSRQN